MTKFSGGSSVAAVGIAGVVIVSAAAWYKYGRDINGTVDAVVVVQPDKGLPLAPVNPVEPKVVPVPEPETALNNEAQVNDVAAPGFDEVRRESDGMTVIAGNAAPGAKVQVMLDGDEVSSTTADRSGKFATLIMIAPDGEGHVLSLAQTLDGNARSSDDQIILAPVDAPLDLAQAEPESAPEKATATESETVPEASALTITQATPSQGSDVGRVLPQVQVDATSTGQPTQTASTLPVGEDQQPDKKDSGLDVADQSAKVARTPENTPQATLEVATSEAPVVTTQPAPQVISSDLPDATTQAETASSTEIAVSSEAVPNNQAATSEQMAKAPQTQMIETKDQAEPRNEVALLKTTPQGVELLNPAAPEVMENVELDTISYSAQGDVQLAGRARNDTKSVRVYLDNASVISLPVDATGRWRGDLPNVDEGIYTLRVDEVGADGTVTSRVETPFKRESPEVLAQAAAQQEGPLKKITVQKGATLWAIAQARYGDGLLYVNVFTANKKDIRDPDLIYPGQVFDLPD